MIFVMLFVITSTMQEGFAMIPHQSPFAAGFLAHTNKNYIFDVNTHIHRFKLFKAIIGPINKINKRNEEVVSDKQNLELVNSGRVGKDGSHRHMTICTEELLYNAIKGVNYFKNNPLTNLRFVASLYGGHINVLCPNEIELIDLTDIRNFVLKNNRKLRINIDGHGQIDELSCVDILTYLDLLQYVTLTYYTTHDRIKQYGRGYDLVYHIGIHPNLLIKQLSDAVPSHLLGTATLINNREFHQEFPTYVAGEIRLDDIIPRMYPKLSSVDRSVIAISSIRTPYIILAHKDVDDDNIISMLHRIFCMIESNHVPIFKDITALMVSTIKTKIEYHTGAVKFYKSLNYHTSSGKSHCVHYSGTTCPLPRPEVFRNYTILSK